MPESVAEIVRSARARAGLSQRELARRSGTAQSVVARIELGLSSPTWETVERLLDAAGFSIRASLGLGPTALAAWTAEAPRVLALSPEDRLRELRNVDRFLAAARRV